MEYENLIKTYSVFHTSDLITFLRIFRKMACAGDSESSKFAVVIKRILEKRNDYIIDHKFRTDPGILERGPERRKYKRRKKTMNEFEKKVEDRSRLYAEQTALSDLDFAVGVLRRSVRNYYHEKISRSEFISSWSAADAKVNQAFEAYREKFRN